MLITTTSVIEGAKITRYYGIVSGETIIGANVFRDFFASIRDVVGGRSGSYEEVLREAKDTALREMQEQARLLGANAVIGVDLDYETVGGSGSMLMVTACGTADGRIKRVWQNKKRLRFISFRHGIIQNSRINFILFREILCNSAPKGNHQVRSDIFFCFSSLWHKFG